MTDSRINPERNAVTGAADKISLSGKISDNTQPVSLFPDRANSGDSTAQDPDSSEVDDAKQAVDDANDAATAASDKATAASGKVETASGKVNTASAELSSANAALAEAQSKKVPGKDANGKDIMVPDTAAIEQAKARVREAQAQLDAAQNELDAANKEYADAKEAEETAKEQVEEKKETLSDAEEKYEAAKKAAEAAKKEGDAQALEAYAQAEEEYGRTTESQNEQDRGSVTVTLDDEDVLSQRVDADGKPVAAFGLQKDENGKKVTDTTAKSLINGTYVDKNGNPVDLDSNEVNSAAWALYDNNQDNPKFKAAIADSYEAATGNKMPATINAADIPAEVILNADLKDVGQDDLNKFTYQNITSLDYAEGADVTLSNKVDFDSKQAVDMDNYYYQNDEEKAEAQGRLAQDIADAYGLDVNNTEAMREALQDIVLTNSDVFEGIDLKNATGDELMELVLGVGSNGKPEDDNIYFSSNTLTLNNIAKAEDGSAKSDEQIKSDITNAIANQYGISAEQLMTSAAGKNILNTIMLDHENDEYFKGVNITSEEDVMNALVTAAKDGKLNKVRTADTSVSFLNSKDYDDDKLQEKALEKTDSYISYLSVKDNEVKSTDLGQKAGEQPTYMDLLSQVQYEMNENGDSVSLKDAIDSAATKLEDAQKGTDEAAKAQAQKEFDSLTELGKSAVQQLAETNPYLFANLYDENGNLNVNNLGEEGLNAKIQNPVDKDGNELKEYDITLQAITYLIPEAPEAQAEAAKTETTQTEPGTKPGTDPKPGPGPTPDPKKPESEKAQDGGKAEAEEVKTQDPQGGDEAEAEEVNPPDAEEVTEEGEEEPEEVPEKECDTEDDVENTEDPDGPGEPGDQDEQEENCDTGDDVNTTQDPDGPGEPGNQDEPGNNENPGTGETTINVDEDQQNGRDDQAQIDGGDTEQTEETSENPGTGESEEGESEEDKECITGENVQGENRPIDTQQPGDQTDPGENGEGDQTVDPAGESQETGDSESESEEGDSEEGDSEEGESEEDKDCKPGENVQGEEDNQNDSEPENQDEGSDNGGESGEESSNNESEEEYTAPEEESSDDESKEEYTAPEEESSDDESKEEYTAPEETSNIEPEDTETGSENPQDIYEKEFLEGEF